MQEAQQAFASEQESQKQQTASLLEACPDAEQYNQVCCVETIGVPHHNLTSLRAQLSSASAPGSE